MPLTSNIKFFMDLNGKESLDFLGVSFVYPNYIVYYFVFLNLPLIIFILFLCFHLLIILHHSLSKASIYEL